MVAEDGARRAKAYEFTKIVEEAAKRWRSRKDEVKTNREAFARGLSPDSEERLLKTRERRLERAARAAVTQDPQAGVTLMRAADLGKERILLDINDMVSVEFFERGIEAAMSVGRVDVGGSVGTGFLVGNNILLTNHHVLSTSEDAMLATLELDAEENRFGAPKRSQAFRLAPQTFWATSEDLDFSFVAVEPTSIEGTPLSAYGWHPLIAGEGKIRVGEGVSIIQHPGGQVKMVAVHNARLIQLRNDVEDEAFCFYTCDTERGSSGSPVFNSNWEVIALHHSAVPETDDKGKVLLRSEPEADPQTKAATRASPRKTVTVEEALGRHSDVAWVANEGIRVSRLVAAFKKIEMLEPSFDRVRSELLSAWSRADVLKASRPQATDMSEAASGNDGSALEAAHHAASGYATFEIPITLSVRVGYPRRTLR